MSLKPSEKQKLREMEKFKLGIDNFVTFLFMKAGYRSAVEKLFKDREKSKADKFKAEVEKLMKALQCKGPTAQAVYEGLKDDFAELGLKSADIKEGVRQENNKWRAYEKQHELPKNSIRLITEEEILTSRIEKCAQVLKKSEYTSIADQFPEIKELFTTFDTNMEEHIKSLWPPPNIEDIIKKCKGKTGVEEELKKTVVNIKLAIIANAMLKGENAKHDTKPQLSGGVLEKIPKVGPMIAAEAKGVMDALINVSFVNEDGGIKMKIDVDSITDAYGETISTDFNEILSQLGVEFNMSEIPNSLKASQNTITVHELLGDILPNQKTFLAQIAREGAVQVGLKNKGFDIKEIEEMFPIQEVRRARGEDVYIQESGYDYDAENDNEEHEEEDQAIQQVRHSAENESPYSVRDGDSSSDGVEDSAIKTNESGLNAVIVSSSPVIEASESAQLDEGKFEYNIIHEGSKQPSKVSSIEVDSLTDRLLELKRIGDEWDEKAKEN